MTKHVLFYCFTVYYTYVDNDKLFTFVDDVNIIRF